MADPTYTPAQLPRATAVSPDAIVPVQDGDNAPVVGLPIKALFGKLLATNSAKATLADLNADLAWDANSVALVFADPTAANNGWYRKLGASGAGSWSQFEVLSANGLAAVQAAATAAQTTIAGLLAQATTLRDQTLAAAATWGSGLAFRGDVAGEGGYIFALTRLDDDGLGERVVAGMRPDGTWQFLGRVDLPGGVSLPAKSVRFAALADDATLRLPFDLPIESGYRWAVTGLDADGLGERVLIAFNAATRRLEAPLDALTAIELAQPGAVDCGTAIVTRAPDGNGLWQLTAHDKATGNQVAITTTGNNIDARPLAGDRVAWRDTTRTRSPLRWASVSGGASRAVIPTRELICYGDSQTQQSAVGGWVDLLWGLLGRSAWSVINAGVSAQQSVQIAARMGVVPIRVRLQGGQIPATATPVALTRCTPNGDNANLAFQGPLTPGSNAAILSLPGSILGVAGTLTYTVNVGYTFTRLAAGQAVNVPNDTPFVVDLTGRDDRIHIIGQGRNFNSASGGGVDGSQVAATSNAEDVALTLLHDVAAVNAIQSAVKRFLILGISNYRDGSEDLGSNGYQRVIDMNAAKRAQFGDWSTGGNFVDWRAYLMDTGPNGGFAAIGAAASAQDNADIALGRIPARFLNADGLHVNVVLAGVSAGDGSRALAALYYKVFQAKNWL